MTRKIGLLFLAFAFVSIGFADTSEAQMRIFDQIVQRPFRALGHGTGPGHHRCNPGPDTSYYNPWTQKNSFLISKSPEYLARFGYEDRSPMSLLRNGQSAYSMSIPGYGSTVSPIAGNPMPLNVDFVPTRQRQSQAEQPAAEDTKTESQPAKPRTPAKVEDSFEDEADRIDDRPEAEAEVGGFESLKSETEVGTLELPSIFLPASHGK